MWEGKGCGGAGVCGKVGRVEREGVGSRRESPPQHSAPTLVKDLWSK